MAIFFRSLSSRDNEELRRFKSIDGLMDFLRQKHVGEIFEPNCFLLIFDTSTQHTWLVASNENLYCVIDRRREASPRVLWRTPMSDLVKDGRIVIDIKADEVSKDIGYVKIGNHKIRKFSTSLFEAEELRKSVELFIVKSGSSRKTQKSGLA